MIAKHFSYRWIIFFLCILIFGLQGLKRANEDAYSKYKDATSTTEWSNTSIWIKSADCARKTGAWLAICENGKLFPFSSYSLADDPGHALLLGLVARIKDKPVSIQDVAKINIIINFLGLFFLGALLFAARLEISSLLLLILGFGQFFIWTGISPHPGLIGVAAMAAIFPVTLLLSEYGFLKGIMRNVFLITGVALLSLATLLRGSIGTMGLIVSIGVLAYLGWDKFGDRRNLRFLLLFLVAIIASQSSRIVLMSRDAFFPIEPSNLIQTHGMAHSLYIGLGAAGENKFGIQWDDSHGWAAVQKVDSDVAYVSLEYFRILRTLYLQHIANDPLEVARIYSLKFIKIIKQRHPDWAPPLLMIVLGAMVLLAVGRGHQIWQTNGSGAAPIFLIVALIFIGLFLAQGVLAHPARQYSYPIGTFSILIIAVSLELFIRHGLRSNERNE